MISKVWQLDKSEVVSWVTVPVVVMHCAALQAEQYIK